MASIRCTEQDDLQELGELLDGVFRLPRGITDQHQLTDFPLVFAPENFRNSRVIVEDGRIVSHAALWPRRFVMEDSESGDPMKLKAAVIVSVATLPDYRNRGHAARLMSDLQETLHNEGYDFAILWTAVPDFYHKLGWHTVVPRGSVFTIGAVDPDNSDTPEFKIARFDPDAHLKGILALFRRQTVRFDRDSDELRLLLTLPKVDVWVATRVSGVAAYLVHGRAVNKQGITEYGGELAGIKELIRHVSTTNADAPIRLHVYHPRTDLADWAARMGWTSKPLEGSKGPPHEMIYVARPHRIPATVRRDLFVWGLDQA